MHTVELRFFQREKLCDFLHHCIYQHSSAQSLSSMWNITQMLRKPCKILAPLPWKCSFEWTWQGEVFVITTAEECTPTTVNKKGIYYFCRTTIQHENLDLLESFVEHVFSFSASCSSDTLKLYFADSHGYWEALEDSHAQSMDNIFIDPSVKEQLDSHISSFLAQRNKYNAFGRPYKLNILLHGVPGSGKSSLVKSIAMKYKRPIYVLSFGKDLTDDKMISLVSQMSDNPILLFEDIDAFFVKRDVNNINVSLSCLLNLLDGTFVRSGMICFLTANQANKLDEALLRPSRIDRVIRFNYPKKEHVAAAYASLVSAPGAMSFEDFYKRIEPTHCEMSGSVEYLFRYGDTPDLEKNMNELLNREQELMLEMEQEGIVPEE